MARASFDSVDSNAEYKGVKPIHSIKYTDDAELLTFTGETYDILTDENRERIERARENIGRYKGAQPSTEPTIGGRDHPQRFRRHSRLVANHFKDLVEQKTGKVTQTKPNTTVVPPSPEISDEADSLIAEEVLFSLKYENKTDAMVTRAVRLALLTGTSFVYHYWDPQKGELHPDSKSLKDSKKKAFLVDKDGAEILDASGGKIPIDKSVYQGDISHELRNIWNTYLVGEECAEKVDGVLLVDFIHVDTLKKRYPGKEIRVDDKATYFNPDTLQEQKLHNHCAVFTVYYRSSQYLEDGLYYRCTRGVVLEKPRANPITYIPRAEFGNLPIRWLRDTVVEGELYGYPTASDIAPLQNIYDKWLTLCVKNLFWGAHFRWIATQGSVDRAELTNDSTIIWVKPGHTPPTGTTFQSFGADAFGFGPALISTMEKIFGIFSISRGAPPPGTRSSSALYFYDDQEKQRAMGLQRSVNDLIVDIDKLTLAIIADNYKDHDERIIKLLGVTKSWIVKKFKVESLRKAYDIRIENTPNLPDSTSLRLQLLTQLKKDAPGVVSDEKFADLLDFGKYDKFITPTRMARLAAQAENDSFRSGETVKDPEKYHDQVVHWQEHIKQMQNPEFETWAESRKDELKLHTMTHERFMDDFGTQSQAFAQVLMGIPQFPVLYTRPPVIQPPVMPMPGGAPGGTTGLDGGLTPEAFPAPGPSGNGGAGGGTPPMPPPATPQQPMQPTA